MNRRTSTRRSFAILLPQSIYPISSRNTILAHYGGVVYGTVPLGEKLGELQYRGFAGQRVLASGDGYFQSLRDQGITLPNGITGHTGGGSLKWNPPVAGLLLGVAESSGTPSGKVLAGPYSGALNVDRFRQFFYLGRYERGKWMIAAEYSRFVALTYVQFAGIPPTIYHTDERPWYVMASYKATSKLTAGLYFSSIFDRRAALGSGRYQKDWALTTRYDFSPFLYVKAEQHWTDGTVIGYSLSDNPTCSHMCACQWSNWG